VELVYVRADGCGVCEQKGPLVRELAAELALPLRVLDFDDPAAAGEVGALRIRTVPTLALREAARVPFRLVGRMITRENVHHLLSTVSLPAREEPPHGDR
jgi:hypothetical protein